MKSITFASLLALLPLAIAQSQEWGQCIYSIILFYGQVKALTSWLGGGIGWAGPTTCVSGTACIESNAYYSQCLPVSVLLLEIYYRINALCRGPRLVAVPVERRNQADPRRLQPAHPVRLAPSRV